MASSVCRVLGGEAVVAKVTWSVQCIPFSTNLFEGELDYDPMRDPGRYGRDYADWTAAVLRGFEARVEDIRTGAVKLVKDTLGATEMGEEPTPEHKHTYVYGDDNNGHSGSFCECGAEEPNENTPSWGRKVEKSEPWKSSGPVKKPVKIDWN